MSKSKTISPLAKLRQAVADYMWSEGCSCCRSIDDHEKNRARLAKLLRVPKYDDGSGYNFAKYRTATNTNEVQSSWETFWQRVRETGWNPTPDELRQALIAREQQPAKKTEDQWICACKLTDARQCASEQRITAATCACECHKLS